MQQFDSYLSDKLAQSEQPNFIDRYLEDNNITFELTAVKGNGEVLARYTSVNSADDVAGYAGLLDDFIEQRALIYKGGN